jgi:hypothetical protein
LLKYLIDDDDDDDDDDNNNNNNYYYLTMYQYYKLSMFTALVLIVYIPPENLRHTVVLE